MVSCNTLPSDGRDTETYIPRRRRDRLPSTLVIQSLNAVATRGTQTYLNGIQDDLLDFRD